MQKIKKEFEIIENIDGLEFRLFAKHSGRINEYIVGLVIEGNGYVYAIHAGVNNFTFNEYIEYLYNEIKTSSFDIKKYFNKYYLEFVSIVYGIIAKNIDLIIKKV